MRTEEAAWFGEALNDIPAEQGEICINLGCSIGPKPDAEDHIFAPIRAKGFKTVHTDLVDRPGVDIVGDIFEASCQARLAALAPRIIVCTSVLEHVPRGRVSEMTEILSGLLAPGGHLLCSVPYCYPYHPDPIDSLYRPSPDQLAGEFPALQVTRRDVVKSTTYLQDLRTFPPEKLRKIPRRLRRPFSRPERFKSQCHRFLWLFRPYKVSCLVLRKPPAPPTPAKAKA